MPLPVLSLTAHNKTLMWLANLPLKRMTRPLPLMNQGQWGVMRLRKLQTLQTHRKPQLQKYQQTM
jgi:hypothetical protein